MRVKVRGGTVAHDERSLCESCRSAVVIRGATLGDEIVECDQLSFVNRRVLFPVTSCTGYVNRNHPTLIQMQDTAWVLRSDPHRNQVGFVRASRLPDDERYVLEED